MLSTKILVRSTNGFAVSITNEKFSNNNFGWQCLLYVLGVAGTES